MAVSHQQQVLKARIYGYHFAPFEYPPHQRFAAMRLLDEAAVGAVAQRFER